MLVSLSLSLSDSFLFLSLLIKYSCATSFVFDVDESGLLLWSSLTGGGTSLLSVMVVYVFVSFSSKLSVPSFVRSFVRSFVS